MSPLAGIMRTHMGDRICLRGHCTKRINGKITHIVLHVKTAPCNKCGTGFAHTDALQTMDQGKDCAICAATTAVHTSSMSNLLPAPHLPSPYTDPFQSNMLMCLYREVIASRPINAFNAAVLHVALVGDITVARATTYLCQWVSPVPSSRILAPHIRPSPCSHSMASQGQLPYRVPRLS